MLFHMTLPKPRAKYQQYSPSKLTNAFLAVKEGRMNMNRASVEYGVPETTLRDRVNGRIDIDTVKPGRPTVLSQEEEAFLAEHLKAMARLGYGYTRQEVLVIATEYAAALERREASNQLTLKWFYGFMGRWPELKVVKGRSLSLLRAKATSPEVVNAYFTELETIVDKYKLSDKPECIINIDEKGIQFSCPSPNVVGRKGDKVQVLTSERGGLVTVIGAGSAIGQQIPPFFVFPGQRMRQELMNGSTAGADGDVSETGWSNSVIFQKYLQTHLMKYLPGRDTSQSILLLYDGHKSHVTLPLIDWAKANNIILFVLPAHTSRSPAHGCWMLWSIPAHICKGKLKVYMRQNPGASVNRYNVCEIVCKAYTLALSPDNIKRAFERTGIYPLNRKAVPESSLAPSEVFNIPFESPIKTTSTEDDNESDTSTINYASPEKSIAKPVDKAVNFFSSKQLTAKFKPTFRAPRKTLSKITSGKPITEAAVSTKVQEHITSYPTSKCKLKFSTPYTKKSKPSPQPKPIKTISKKQISKTCTTYSSPQPSTSGLQKIIISDDENYSSDSQEVDESEKCCVCKKVKPDQLRNCLSIVFPKWVQCDFQGCEHWVHLIYCVKTRVVRRADVFFCPCHPNPGVQVTSEE